MTYHIRKLLPPFLVCANTVGPINEKINELYMFCRLIYPVGL